MLSRRGWLVLSGVVGAVVLGGGLGAGGYFLSLMVNSNTVTIGLTAGGTALGAITGGGFIPWIVGDYIPIAQAAPVIIPADQDILPISQYKPLTDEQTVQLLANESKRQKEADELDNNPEEFKIIMEEKSQPRQPLAPGGLDDYIPSRSTSSSLIKIVADRERKEIHIYKESEDMQQLLELEEVEKGINELNELESKKHNNNAFFKGEKEGKENEKQDQEKGKKLVLRPNPEN